MKKAYRVFFLASLIFLVSGCLPFNAPAAQPDAVNIETIVAATHAASVAQTKAVLPTATATVPNTATPTKTHVPPTITPTFTATFIISTATPSPTSTPTYTFTPAATATPAIFDCELVSQTPANGTTMGSKNDFDWVWKVTNTGIKDWSASEVDYVYVSGEKMHKTEGYDLPADTESGDNIKLGVDMIAPKNPGTYTTTWGLKKGKQIFCTVTLKIIVK